MVDELDSNHVPASHGAQGLDPNSDPFKDFDFQVCLKDIPGQICFCFNCLAVQDEDIPSVVTQTQYPMPIQPLSPASRALMLEPFTEMDQFFNEPEPEVSADHLNIFGSGNEASPLLEPSPPANQFIHPVQDPMSVMPNNINAAPPHPIPPPPQPAPGLDSDWPARLSYARANQQALMSIDAHHLREVAIAADATPRDAAAARQANAQFADLRQRRNRMRNNEAARRSRQLKIRRIEAAEADAAGLRRLLEEAQAENVVLRRVCEERGVSGAVLEQRIGAGREGQGQGLGQGQGQGQGQEQGQVQAVASLPEAPPRPSRSAAASGRARRQRARLAMQAEHQQRQEQIQAMQQPFPQGQTMQWLNNLEVPPLALPEMIPQFAPQQANSPGPQYQTPVQQADVEVAEMDEESFALQRLANYL